MERLDKLLAATGRWSRKEAKALVKAGRVRVAGVLPQGPEDKVTPGTPVTVDGRLIFIGSVRMCKTHFYCSFPVYCRYYTMVHTILK